MADATCVVLWGAAAVLGMCAGLRGARGAEPFLQPPRVIESPGPAHRAASRKFQGIPSLARAPRGRLWATWYGGKTPGEDRNNYVVLVTSDDDGATWSSERLAVDPDGEGPVRAFDPQLWLDPGGRLWFFWAQAAGHDLSVGGVWAMTTEEPDKPAPAWSPPRRLTDGVMMGKPTVLSSGEWLLPASCWRTDGSARVVASADRGRTWRLRGACNVPPAARNCDEHLIVERQDGSLWMWVRTTYGIGESVSTDRGRTWGALGPSAVRHPTARFFLRRLRSGSLLLVKHGPLERRTGRSHLTAYRSTDDGRSWEGTLLLDERAGVSYPDGVQAEDGTIYIIYDRDRTGAREILMARFAEEDVARGRLVTPRAAERLVVSRGGP